MKETTVQIKSDSFASSCTDFFSGTAYIKDISKTKNNSQKEEEEERKKERKKERKNKGEGRPTFSDSFKLTNA